MKLRQATILIVSVSFMNSQVAWAQMNNGATIVSDKFLQATSATTTTTTTTTSTSTLPTAASIQQEAMMVQKSNQNGIQVAEMLTKIAMVGVAVSCYKSSPKCKWWVAGLAATYLMASNMKKAADEADYAGGVVTVEPPDRNIHNAQITNPEENPPTSEGSSDAINNNVKLKERSPVSPDMRKAKAAIDSLKKQGWKIDEKKGDIVTPKGEKINTAMLKSPQAMARAGAPASFIKDFSNMPKQAAKKVAEQSKSADAGEGAFGDSVGGGGGGGRASFAGSADGLGAYGGGGIPGGAPAAADRAPSQVAGMSTNYNGEKIGVAGDSLFHMIDRRYELHQKKGSFLEP